jgi:hypothetical protein
MGADPMTNSDLATARWAVALEGDPFDIENARDLFAKHDKVQVRIIEVAPDRNPTGLLAKDFETLNKPPALGSALAWTIVAAACCRKDDGDLLRRRANRYSVD